MTFPSAVLVSLLLLAPGTATAAAGTATPAPGDSSPATISPREMRELVARVVRAYGGRSALRHVRAYRAEGHIVALRQSREGPTLRLFQRPDRLRVELHYPQGPEIRIVAGTRGWRGPEGGLEPAGGPMLDAMLLQAARAAVPWILMDRVADLRRIAPREHRGRPLVGVETPVGEGLTLRAWIDPVTGRVEVSQGVLQHHGMSTLFETVYDDFRPVHGVLFAFREENYASGARTGYTAIERIELNPRVTPGDFAPAPAKGRDS